MRKPILVQLAIVALIIAAFAPITAIVEASERPELLSTTQDLDRMLRSMSAKADGAHFETPSLCSPDSPVVDLAKNATIEATAWDKINYEANNLPDLNGTATGSSLGYTPNGRTTIAAYDPNRPAAPPLDVAKEGHWFPNQDYSRIRYDINLYDVYQGLPMQYSYYVHIDRGDDPYLRYFRVYFDGSKVYETTIGSAGFDGNINIVSTPWNHRIQLEICWGYYSDHAWKLVSFKPGYGEVVGEFFPFKDYGRMRFNVYMGTDTKAEVKIEKVDDPYTRILRFFVDGVQVGGDQYAPCDITFNLGNYATNSSHEIMIQVHWCYYKEWGYRLTKFRVHYAAVNAEIDFMDGHRPHDDVLSYIGTYYTVRGYQRFTFVVDEQVPHDDQVTWNEYNNNYYNVWFDHIGQAGLWKYVLFGHSSDMAGVFGWTDQLGGNRIFIADQTCDDYANDWWNYWIGGVRDTQVEKLVLMHEGGHSIRICELDGQGHEVYCSNTFCVMATVSWDNCDDNPYYCTYHWSQRRYP